MTDPVAIARGLTKAQRRTFDAVPDGHWATISEMAPHATGAAATLLCFRSKPLVERRWATWGSDRVNKQTRGEGYEYRLTDAGRELRALLTNAAGGGGE